MLEKCEKILKILFERVKNQKKITYKDIDEIILVGGTTRSPTTQKIFETYFPGKPIFQNLNSDEAVAQGAAISAMKVKK